MSCWNFFFLYTNRGLNGIKGRFLHKKRNVLGEFLCDEKCVLEKIAKSLPIYLVLPMSVLIQKKRAVNVKHIGFAFLKRDI